jgi:PIN domain nuclease of toxin-antitoxin system
VILLLDAHALLWALTSPEEIPAETRLAIADPANDVLVSAGSIWELEIKQAAGKLRYRVDLIDEIDRVGFSLLPITAADATTAARLPPHHRDPFDRMLVAQGERLGAIVVTRDPIFARYGVDTLTA